MFSSCTIKLKTVCVFLGIYVLLFSHVPAQNPLKGGALCPVSYVFSIPYTGILGKKKPWEGEKVLFYLECQFWCGYMVCLTERNLKWQLAVVRMGLAQRPNSGYQKCNFSSRSNNHCNHRKIWAKYDRSCTQRSSEIVTEENLSRSQSQEQSEWEKAAVMQTQQVGWTATGVESSLHFSLCPFRRTLSSTGPFLDLTPARAQEGRRDLLAHNTDPPTMFLSQCREVPLPTLNHGGERDLWGGW